MPSPMTRYAPAAHAAPRLRTTLRTIGLTGKDFADLTGYTQDGVAAWGNSL